MDELAGVGELGVVRDDRPGVGAVGRVFIRDYRSLSRTDVSEVLALTANYRITKYFSAGAASTFASSRSSKSVFDYDVANIGGALSLTWKF